MPWTPGMSGNPRGRPAKKRAVAETIRTTSGEHSASGETYQMALARVLWGGISSGHITFENGKTFDLGFKDWLDLLKWVVEHVDGPGKFAGGEEEPSTPRVVDIDFKRAPSRTWEERLAELQDRDEE
jgi:hypothetical protein